MIELTSRNLLQRVHVYREAGEGTLIARFVCPGCSHLHDCCVQQGKTKNDNGDEVATNYAMWHPPADMMKPVLKGNGGSSSVLVSVPLYAEDDLTIIGQDVLCHSYVGINGAKPGQIIFLNDCQHYLAGKIVDLPEFSNTYRGIMKARREAKAKGGGLKWETGK